MKGEAKEITICGKTIKLGDYVEVDYESGGGIRGRVTELWSPEISNGHLQARVENGWCFHDYDRITIHRAAVSS
jgi:hypothetical protein